MKQDVWYKDGLCFECLGCGGCCRGPGGYVWLTLEEMEKIALRLKIPFKQFTRRYVRQVQERYALIDNAAGDCVFLNAQGKCEVYEERPEQCRTFPWWPENLTHQESWDGNYNECPGINQGKRYDVETIQRHAGLSKIQ